MFQSAMLLRRAVPASLAPRVCTRAFSSITDPTAAPRVAHLASRGVLALSGTGAAVFLQGLTTNNMASLSTPAYTGFLTAQGRVLYDALIVPHKDLPDAFLIDADRAHVAALRSHLRRYLLRSKLALTDVTDEYRVFAQWPATGSADSLNLGGVGFADPRWSGLGARAILPAAQAPPVPTTSAELEYALFRYQHGIAEGADLASGTSLPLESNMDLLHGIDFRKGCYVGQELTIRTYHTGVVRKRIVPVVVAPSGEDVPDHWAVDRTVEWPVPPAQAELVGANGKSAGKFAVGKFNVGLALVRLDAVRKGEALTVAGEPGWTVKPFWPAWWPPLQDHGRS
ncbi:folate-binding protein YgfZ [Allomyces macrogynus ATCC 38327]|uniref:Folate-binding protein YgfZ n=1 Tax=Allomyces macrogynus (strain ATCC 38327) TaxID=578462 RepID=A0A0L0SFF3_ALLM3|nr:folate-binding protein YgfZ [Allomyces macrogynus ATCC 38327]|eukprot:KNE61177.1 folate-binding protein YgfZ [Allomyces macrogynus ATCC 38327]